VSPQRARPPCLVWPCRQLQPCPEHPRQPWQGAGRRMPPGWPQTVARIRARDRGCCRVCGGPGAVVDHIQRGGPEADWNLQLLCQPCSDAKTEAEALAARRARLGW